MIAFARFDRGHIEVLDGDYRPGLQRMIEADRLLDELGREGLAGDAAAWVSDAIPQDAPLIAGERLDAIENASDSRRGTLVQWLVETGRFEEADGLGSPYIDRLSRVTLLDDQRTSSLGDAWFGLGRIQAQRGDPDRAMRSLDRAIECYRRIDHHLLMASTLRVRLAEVLIPYRPIGVEERRRLAEEAEQAYRQASGAADDTLAAGFASLEQMILEGRWAEAGNLLAAMEDQPGGIVVWRHRTAALLARLAFERGDCELAWRHIATILPDGPGTEPGSTTYVRAIELHLLAVELSLDVGELDAVGSWLDALDRWLGWSGAVRGRAGAQLAWASYFAAGGDRRAALDLAERTIASAERPSQPLVLLATHRFLGSLLVEDDRTEAAIGHLQEALTISEAVAAPFEVARTKLAPNASSQAVKSSRLRRWLRQQVASSSSSELPAG